MALVGNYSGKNSGSKGVINRTMVTAIGDEFYNEPYDVLDRVSLNFFDPEKNSNKFYILEVHSDLSKSTFRLFANHGRVGENRGALLAKKYSDIDSVKHDFAKKVKEKERKGYKGVDLVTFSKGSDECRRQINVGSLGDDFVPKTAGCMIDDKVQQLVTKMYDEANQAISLSMSGSVRTSIKAPLGNLGVNGIQIGRNIIMQLDRAIKRNCIPDIIELSKEYYKYVPRKMPRNIKADDSWVLNTTNKLETELNTLSLYEDSLKLLPLIGVSDIDAKYRGLETDISIVTDTQELDYVSHKIHDSKARNHNYNISIKNVFKVRQNNVGAFNDYCGNVKRLFHGSRSANLVGILSGGLKLPTLLPSSVSKTGAAFGAGLYFASNSTKSLQYSVGRFGGRKNKYDSCFLFICSVALGNINFRTQYNSSLTAPQGFNSVMGIGEDTLKNMIKRGEMPKGTTTRLINNEFIVYDRSQVRIDYIVEVEL